MNKKLCLFPFETLDSYVSDNPDENILPIIGFLNTNFNDLDILVIKSQQGCGGTHLLGAIANDLLVREIDIRYLSAEKLLELIVSNKNGFAEYFGNSCFLFIDDIDLFFNCNKLQSFALFKEWLAEFIANNGKLICTHTDIEWHIQDVEYRIGKYRIHEVVSLMPSYDSLIKIAKQQFSIDLIEKYKKEINFNVGSVRELVNQFVSFEAKDYLSNNLEIN